MFFIQTICDSFKNKSILATNGKFDLPSEESIKISYKLSPYKASWCNQFMALLWRSFITNSREPMITRIKFSQTIVSFLVCLVISLQNKLLLS